MAPKKSVKSMKPEMSKPIERPITKSKKPKKKNYRSFGIYLYKILKTINRDSGISTQSMVIMNNFVMDMFENIAAEAGKLISHTKKTTLSSSDLQSAVKLLVPGELWKHANAQGIKALTIYHNNQARPSE
ncbi:unnamed protein product [Colias eurytheme]|nr:unnamed protein product [Colias eurytheme]